MKKIAVILPSRGLMFSRTAQELLNCLEGIAHVIFFAHKQPIPGCFEVPAERALKQANITHLFFVEDDMILPPDCLQRMLLADVDVATYDYPVLKSGQGAVFYDPSGKVIFCGTGCMLVKREVFDHLTKPYFRTDIRWQPLNYGDAIKFTGYYQKNKVGYGMHDVTLGIKLLQAGISITVLPGNLGQRKLVALGKAGTNKGAHTIQQWRKVRPNLFLRQVMDYPVVPGEYTRLVTVDTPSGGVTTTKKHAETLVSQGLGEYPKQTAFILDTSEVSL